MGIIGRVLETITEDGILMDQKGLDDMFRSMNINPESFPIPKDAFEGGRLSQEGMLEILADIAPVLEQANGFKVSSEALQTAFEDVLTQGLDLKEGALEKLAIIEQIDIDASQANQLEANLSSLEQPEPDSTPTPVFSPNP